MSLAASRTVFASGSGISESAADATAPYSSVKDLCMASFDRIAEAAACRTWFVRPGMGSLPIRPHRCRLLVLDPVRNTFSDHNRSQVGVGTDYVRHDEASATLIFSVTIDPAILIDHCQWIT